MKKVELGIKKISKKQRSCCRLQFRHLKTRHELLSPKFNIYYIAGLDNWFGFAKMLKPKRFYFCIFIFNSLFT